MQNYRQRNCFHLVLRWIEVRLIESDRAFLAVFVERADFGGIDADQFRKNADRDPLVAGFRGGPIAVGAQRRHGGLQEGFESEIEAAVEAVARILAVRDPAPDLGEVARHLFLARPGLVQAATQHVIEGRFHHRSA